MACIRDQDLTIRAVCLPEMKKNHTYKIEIVQHASSNDIISAKCGCPAGCGPKGSCKHIAAVCYALEEFHRIKTTKEFIASTSKLQEWNRPRKRVLDPQDADEIKYVKLEHEKVKRDHLNSTYDPRPQHLQHTSSSELDAFHDELSSFDRAYGFLHVLPDSSIPSTSASTASLPPIPRSVQEKILAKMKSIEHPLSTQQISNLGSFFVDGITPNYPQAELVEKLTSTQYTSKRWHEERFARLTSSRFGEICKSRQPTTLCTKML